MRHVATGIDGLDPLIGGGFPEGSCVLVQGPAGNELKAFGVQFVAEGLRSGGSALVVLASIPVRDFLADLSAAGVDTDSIAAEGRIRIVTRVGGGSSAIGDLAQDGITIAASGGPADLNRGITDAISFLVERPGPRRALLEVLSPLAAEHDPIHVRDFAETTRGKLSRGGFASVALLIRDLHDPSALMELQLVFDGAIDVERDRWHGRVEYYLQILALPGATSHPIPYSLRIDKKRLTVGPLEGSAKEAWEELRSPHRSPQERIPSQPHDLDRLFAKAATMAKMGEVREALETLETLRRIDKAYPGLWSLKADLQEQLGAFEGARRSRQHEAELARRGVSSHGTAPPCPSCGAPREASEHGCLSCGATLVDAPTIGSIFRPGYGHGAAVPRESAPPRGEPITCPACDTKTDTAVAECPSCGLPLRTPPRAEPTICPACDTKTDPAVRECPSCGLLLRGPDT